MSNHEQRADGFAGGKNKTRLGGLGGQKMMFDATCTDCGKPCQVPFRPLGDKPVYCRECFSKRRGNVPGGYGRAGGEPRNLRQPHFTSPKPSISPVRLEEVQRQLYVISAKLDTLLQKVAGAGPGEHTPAVKNTSTRKQRKSRKASKK